MTMAVAPRHPRFPAVVAGKLAVQQAGDRIVAGRGLRSTSTAVHRRSGCSVAMVAATALDRRLDWIDSPVADWLRSTRDDPQSRCLRRLARGGHALQYVQQARTGLNGVFAYDGVGQFVDSRHVEACEIHDGFDDPNAGVA